MGSDRSDQPGWSGAGEPEYWRAAARPGAGAGGGWQQAAGQPGPDEPGGQGHPLGYQPAGARRDGVRRDGVRRVRMMSNWTAVALIAGTGAVTVALASQALPASTSAATSHPAATGAQSSSAPHVAGAVATSGGSGTTTTVTRVVNGKTVVTQVRQPAAYHDS